MNDKELRHDRDQEDGHDVGDLDQRIDGWASGVLVRIADGVAGDGGSVRFRALTAEIAFLDIFLGVVPCAAAGRHRDSHENAGDDRADQHRAQSLERGQPGMRQAIRRRE